MEEKTVGIEARAWLEGLHGSRYSVGSETLGRVTIYPKVIEAVLLRALSTPTITSKQQAGLAWI